MQLNMWIATMMIAMTLGCNKPTEQKAALVQKHELNVSYGKHAQQKLDYYLPANRNSNDTKVLVLIHGGGWVGGDKRDFNTTVDSLKTELNDYAIFNINYRLATMSGTNLWPSQLNDVDAAIQFIIENAEAYNINPEKIVLAGASAGAHLALLQAYSSNNEKRIKAVIDLFGPTDMEDMYSNATGNFPFLLSIFLNGTPSSNKIGYEKASPVKQITKNAPPTLILHGTNDRTVPIRQSELLKSALDKNNVVNQYVTYKGEGHGWYGKNLSDTYDKMVNFIRQNVY
jgi:acetyl esterase/lipase